MGLGIEMQSVLVQLELKCGLTCDQPNYYRIMHLRM